MTPDGFRALVSRVLIVGVTISAALVALGFVGSLAVGWEGSLRGAGQGSGRLSDFGSMAASLVALRPVGIAQLGLVVLVATPVVRVAASVAAFALEGDRLYTAITVVVLGILLASLFFLR